ncbi:SGNH/GDSL hydrolase family protein [Actinomadura rugatobispora]|uniref:SGNH/GDSL hydrolase family protein n=1 Tax=Actinomadura rugatobispora TaxID=1994 RepID=A0ABW1A221_9ACTN|nr:SGNH/GDSL hydrolase family protein [Actinomadura rugatobispora]
MNALLMPVVAVQGLWVRSRTERLPEASGPAGGAAGEGAGPPVRLAVLGESTAAGCGVGTHDEGFPGCLARELAARDRRPVTWEVVGQNTATAHRIRHRLLPRLGGGLDVAVLLAGVNDVLTRRDPRQWGEDLAAIVDGLGERAAHVAVTGIPPFEAFPSLPGALGRYLARRADALDEVSRRVCERAGATWVGSGGIVPEPVDPDFFARDRFHPSASGYRRWAGAVAGHLAF